MNKVKGALPIIAFVFAAFAAFAFTPAQAPEYALINGQWTDISNLDPGTDYVCDESTEVCTRSAPNPSASPMKPGQFELIEP